MSNSGREASFDDSSQLPIAGGTFPDKNLVEYGVYCIVLIVGSVVVSAGLLRIFGREVAELPLVATSRQNQGKGYFQALFLCIEKLLLSLNVENLVLPAAEEAESIWTKKLGFRKMTDERYLKYSTDLQLTVFKGTSMLEKALEQHVSE